MKINIKVLLLFICATTLGVVHFSGSEGSAQPSFFKSRGCRSCHKSPTAATCDGCHKHGPVTLKVVTDKTTYAPGEPVKATLKGGSRGGWFRAILYNQNNTQVAISKGNASGKGHSTKFPASLTAPAPNKTGAYTWKMAWYGNNDGNGHGKVAKSFTFKVANAAKQAVNLSVMGDGALSKEDTLNVSGTARDTGGLQSVTVNGQAVTVDAAGSFSTALTLKAGANTITVVACDKAGNQQSDSRTIIYDPAAPVLTIASPADNSGSVQSFITIAGTIDETSTVTVTNNNGAPQNASVSGASFTATVNLVPGVNTIVTNTTDPAGKTTTAKRTITYDSSALTLAVTSPNQDITTSDANFVLTGAIADAVSDATIRINMNGMALPAPTVNNGLFSKELTFMRAGKYAITVSATDAAGNANTITRNVIYRPAVAAVEQSGNEN
jgi:hypothetical protein